MKRIKKIKFIIPILFITLMVCAAAYLTRNTSKTNPFFVTQTVTATYRGVAATERGQGILTIVNDCVAIQNGDLIWHPIWPSGFQYDRESQTISNVWGGKIASVGDTIAFGGGTNVQREALIKMSSMAPQWQDQFIEQCAAPYWVVTNGSIKNAE